MWNFLYYLCRIKASDSGQQFVCLLLERFSSWTDNVSTEKGEKFKTFFIAVR